MKERMYKAIQMLTRDHANVFLAIFTAPCELKASPEQIREETKHFSSGEQIVRDMALSIWSGEEKVSIYEYVNTVDSTLKQTLVDALIYLMRY